MKRDDTPMPIVFMDSDDAEREYLIREYGQNMLDAYACGDRKAAAQWLQLQEEAIAGRSPGQVLKLEQEKGLV